MTEQADRTAEERPEDTQSGLGYAVGGVLGVLAPGATTRFLETQVPQWATATPLAGVAKAIEFPVYAIALGLIGNFVLNKFALHDALSKGFRTEFFIKTGLVLLGASINLKVLVTAAGPAIIQALLLISIVFGFTWWLAGLLNLDAKLRALLASAVSICGVSAAIAAAGAVQAKRGNSPTRRHLSSRSLCHRSSCCPGSPTSSACRIPSRVRGSAATSTPPLPLPPPARSPARLRCRSRPSSRPRRTR